MGVENIVRKPDGIVASPTGNKASDHSIWCENALQRLSVEPPYFPYIKQQESA